MENHSVKVDKDLFVDKLFGLHPYYLYGTHKLVFLSQGQQEECRGWFQWLFFELDWVTWLEALIDSSSSIDLRLKYLSGNMLI